MGEPLVPGPSHLEVEIALTNVGQVKVKVTFRPTVSQSVRLGVKPILGLLTRNLSSCEVYF
jgi:hypothetical protein